VSQYNTSSSPYKVQVVDRALALLDILAKQRGGCGLADMCLHLQLNKSTVHRLLMVLEQHRMVEKDPETGRYRLGLKLFELGSKAISGLDLAERVRPHMHRLQRETGETVNFAILDKCEVLYLEKVDSQNHLRIAAVVGDRCPAYSTALGKSILASLPEEDVDKILHSVKLQARTPTTLTSLAAIREELRITRNRGYAIDDEENMEGVRCVAAPVRDHQGHPVAAISVAGPAIRVTKNCIPKLAIEVVGSARAISCEMGFKSEDLQEANLKA
jgi:IclR family transcriptional regulator, KDG regulon repressor